MRRLRKLLSTIPIFLYVLYRIEFYIVKEGIGSESTHIDIKSVIENVYIHDTPRPFSMYESSKKFFINANFQFNCSNIPAIIIKQKIGNGISKQGYLGEYNGVRVVIKVASSTLSAAKDCVSRANKIGANETLAMCYAYPQMQLLKEILLLHELRHPNIAPLLGYCVKGYIETDEVTNQGILSVLEFGVPVTVKYLSSTSWKEHFRHALNLAQLMLYLEMSPLGSLLYSDYKMSHFYMVNSSIKVSDMDSATDRELVVTEKRPCTVGVVVDGRCVGYNAVVNLRITYLLFYRTLLDPKVYPHGISDRIQSVKYKLYSNQLSAQELVQELKNISKIYHDIFNSAVP